MVSLRTMKLLAFIVVLTTISRGTSATEDCATPGECENPEAEEIVVAEVDEPAVEVEEVVVEVEADEPAPEEEDPNCPSRPQVIRCAAAHLDTNKNNKLERAELQEAIDALPWYAKGVLKILGSVNSIMKKCDADGDDAIGIDNDMEQTKDRCLATCFKRKAFKRAFFPDCDL